MTIRELPVTALYLTRRGPWRRPERSRRRRVETAMSKLFYTGCPICSRTWVGLTLIWVFHPLVQLPSRFCQNPTAQAESDRQCNTQNPSQPNPVYEQMGHPVCLLSLPTLSIITNQGPSQFQDRLEQRRDVVASGIHEFGACLANWSEIQWSCY